MKSAGRMVLVTALFAAAIAGVFSPVLLMYGQAPWFGLLDFWRYHTPNAFYLDSCLHAGRFPLWNPLVLCGMPFAANPQAGLFYPPNLARGLLTFTPTPMETHNGLVILIGLHTLIAAAGMYRFARRQEVSPWGAGVAAAVYVFNAAYVMHALGYWVVPAALAWLPVLMLTVRRGIEIPAWRGKLRAGLIAGMLLALALLAGFPQVVVYMGVLLAAYVALESLRTPVFAHARGNAILMGAMLTVGALGAGAMLVPAGELAQFADRGRASAVDVSDATMFQYSLVSLIENLFRYPGEAALTGMQSAGAGAMLLALCGLTHANRRAVRVHLVLFALLLDCAIGPPMPVATLVDTFAPFKMGLSNRAFLVAAFPLAMLAGLGVDAAITRARPWMNAVRTLGLLVTALLTLTPLWFWQQGSPFVDAGAWIVLLPAALAVLLAAAAWMPRRKWLPVRPAIAALLFAELVAWNQVFIPYALSLFPLNAPVEQLKYRVAFGDDAHRIVEPTPNCSLFRLQSAMNGYEPAYLSHVRQVLSSPRDEQGYDRFIDAVEAAAENARGHTLLKRRFWLVPNHLPGPLPPKHEAFACADVAYIDDDSPVKPEWPPLPEPPVRVSAQAVATRLDDALARAERVELANHIEPGWAIGRGVRYTLPTVRLPRGHRVLRVLAQGDGKIDVRPRFGNALTGHVEEGLRLQLGLMLPGAPITFEVPLPDFEWMDITLTAAGGAFTIQEAAVLHEPIDGERYIAILDTGPNQASLAIHRLPEQRLLVLVESRYPGWRAYLDGKRVPILHANDAFQAITVPLGTHQVQFVFRPWSVYIGVTVSLLTFAGACLYLFYHRCTPIHTD